MVRADLTEHICVYRKHLVGGQMSAVSALGDRRNENSASVYLKLLVWAFGIFSFARVLAYLPTILAICQAGDSGQHSLFTWGTWFGANVTMAGMLYEKSGGRFEATIAVTLGNAALCLLTVAVIVWQRVG
jgi:hypothetical protein